MNFLGRTNARSIYNIVYNTILKEEAKYPINFTQSGKKFVLKIHYNGSKSFLFVNATKIHQFKAKDS